MEKDEKSLLKRGIWIQEKEGVLTMGSLDPRDTRVVELSPEFTFTIFQLEQEMKDALYGDQARAFTPGKTRLKTILERVIKGFDTTGVHVSISCPDSAVIYGDSDGLFDLFSGFVKNSLEHELCGVSSPAIHISVSVVGDTLCMVYRDSGTGSVGSRLDKEIRYIKEILKGEVNQKSTPGKGSYFDIAIKQQKPF
ncbi:MAG: hypothetical protein RBR67_10935 [Desulfobacterium sp.]|jgi:light-regulated signal transduction histidine kinase (bacteriophytochrome)|nr:hypothetical protein [Desulfobacterium sp.]